MQRFPLLSLMLAAYWALQTLTGERVEPWYQAGAYSFCLPSGEVWLIRGGELFIGLSTILLFVEIVRATRISTASITNHALSVLVFVAALILFLTQLGYGNSIFFMFVLLTAFDFIAGFIVTTAGARRDVTLGRVERHA